MDRSIRVRSAAQALEQRARHARSGSDNRDTDDLLLAGGHAEIAFEVPPHAVYVVRLVLVRIVLLIQELDEEGRPLNAVGTLLPGFHAALVGEMDLVDPAVRRGRQLGPGHVLGEAVRVS